MHHHLISTLLYFSCEEVSINCFPVTGYKDIFRTPLQTSKVELFAKLVTGLKSWTVFAESSICFQGFLMRLWDNEKCKDTSHWPATVLKMSQMHRCFSRILLVQISYLVSSLVFPERNIALKWDNDSMSFCTILKVSQLHEERAAVNLEKVFSQIKWVFLSRICLLNICS